MIQQSILATVVVRSASSFGNGVIISDDGWILSSYRVVAAAAQAAALTGAPVTVDVRLPRMVDGQARQGATVQAVVYRADPVRDLVLLKIGRPDPKLPYARVATAAKLPEECLVVGSRAGAEAWGLSMCTISRSFLLPESDGATFNRWRISAVATDAQLQDGLIGAPLFNYRSGELIGMTLVPHVKERNEAWHVGSQDVSAFVSPLPAEPEPIPFDAWTAGTADAVLIEPALSDSNQDGRLDTLRYSYAASAARMDLVALTIFVDFDRTAGLASDTDRMPHGVWAAPADSTFRFDTFVSTRADGVVATGYTNAVGMVDEIRTGKSSVADASMIWRRDGAGRWQSKVPATQTPLIDASRLTAEQSALLMKSAGPLLLAKPRD